MKILNRKNLVYNISHFKTSEHYFVKVPPGGSRPHLAQHVTVEDLEDLIEAKLAESLHGVANEGGRPALGQPPHAVLPHCHLEAISDGFVLFWAHLQGAP